MGHVAWEPGSPNTMLCFPGVEARARAHMAAVKTNDVPVLQMLCRQWWGALGSRLISKGTS